MNGGASRNRLYEVVLDEATLPRVSPDADHEREVAIFDLVEENSFGVIGRDDGLKGIRPGRGPNRTFTQSGWFWLGFLARPRSGPTAIAALSQ